MIVKETQHLIFEEIATLPSRKTGIWHVKGKQNGFWLGTIKWYGPWRQYCFWPCEETLFNRGCLEDIRHFLSDPPAKQLVPTSPLPE